MTARLACHDITERSETADKPSDLMDNNDRCGITPSWPLGRITSHPVWS
jgi:hypothetical protein